MEQHEFTATERKFLAMFKDGEPKTIEQLQTCLWDEMAGYGAIKANIIKMRVKLKPKGYNIIVTRVHGRKIAYVMVRTLTSVQD